VTNTPDLRVLTFEYGGVTSHSGGFGLRMQAFLPKLAQAGLEIQVHLYPSFPLNPRVTAEPDIRLGERLRLRIERTQPIVGRLSPIKRAALVRKTIQNAEAISPARWILAPEWTGLGAFLPRRIAKKLLTNLVTPLALVTELQRCDGSTSSGLEPFLQARLEQMQTTRSGKRVACSPALATWAMNRWRLHNCAVIPNCIDLAHVQGLKSHDRTGSTISSRPVIGYLGRLEHRKGVIYLVRAFRHLIEQGVDAELHLIGRDSLEEDTWVSERLMSEAGPGVSSRMQILGDMPHDQALRTLAATTIAVFPSLWEAFGNVALEAKALGVPVIVTSGSGFESFCENRVDALVVQPRDFPALARAMIELIGDEDLRGRLRTAGLAKSPHYSAEAIAQRWIHLLGMG
jgi:glycogen synthase